MARKMEVEVVGDSRQLERAFSRAGRSAKEFNSQIGRLGRGGVAGSGVFKSMGRQIAFASSAFIGGAGFVAATKNAITAASDLNEQMSKNQQVFGDSAAQIEEWSKTSATAMGQSQRQALATASSFGALFRPMGMTGQQAADQSKKLTQLGADLASFYNTDVQDALDAIRSGIVGESEPLRRYGVLLSETRVQQEAMSETGKKNAKQLTAQEKAAARITLIFKDTALAQGDFARTSGGLANQLRIAGANIDDLQTHIGELLVPSITKAVNSFNEWISDTRNQQRVLDDVKQVVGAVTDVLKVLQGVMKTLNSITGSTRNSLKLLLGVLLAYKTAKGVAGLAGVAADIATIGTKAKAATGEAKGLRTALLGLETLGPIGIAVAITVTAFAVQPYVTKALNKLFEATGLRHKPTSGGRSRLVFRRGRLVWSGSGTPYERGQTRDPVGTVAGGTKPISQDPFATARGAFAQPSPTAAGLRGGGRKPRKFGGTYIDWLQLQIDKAGLTKGMADDLAAMRKLESYLKKRIRAAGHNLQLESQLVSVQKQEKDLIAQQAQAAADAAKAAKEAAKARREAAKEAAKEAAERRSRAQSARLFGILGLGPGGEAKIPSRGLLQKQLDAMRGQLKTAPARLRRQAAAIQKVLREAFIPPDVRSKLREMLNAIQQELKKKTGAGGPLTKWGVQSTDAVVRGLGLSREQAVRLQQRLAGRGPGGTVARRGAGLGGAFGMAGGVVITGPVTVVANNPEEFVKAVDRKRRRGAVSRSGPRAGQRGD